MVWGRAIEVDWRSVPERFIVDNEFDYFRCRNRFRVKHARHQDVGGGVKSLWMRTVREAPDTL